MSEWFENGILRVLVPSGWGLFYGIDSEGNDLAQAVETELIIPLLRFLVY